MLLFKLKKFISRVLDLPNTRKMLKYPLILSGYSLSYFMLLFLWLISPVIKIKIGGLPGQRLGHLALNTDLFFRQVQLKIIKKDFMPVFLIGRVANRQLLKMWKRHICIIESRIVRVLFEYSIPLWKKTMFYEPLELLSNEYYEFNVAKPTLNFTLEEESKGEQFLRSLGIDPEKDWFVYLFARDSAYLTKEFGLQKDWSYHDYRDSDIDNFKLAIDYIIGLGGFVIRMGHHVNKSLNYNHPHVIDYAMSMRSDFLDVYLASKCRFVLGNSSGIGDLPVIFDRPRLCVDTAPLTSPPFGKNNLFIPKKIKSSHNDQYISYADFIAATSDVIPKDFEFRGDRFAEQGWKYEDNSAQEILDATIEMVDRISNNFLQNEEDLQLLLRYYNLFPKNHWAEKNKTPIGKAFLKQHYNLFFKDHYITSPNVETV